MGFISYIFGYVLNFFYNLLNNYGLAIIIFTILLRCILIPITIKQQKTMKKTAKIQEKMKELQIKYKNNQEKLNQETIELYKTEKMSPFSGCFSAIIQLIIILAVFWLVSQPLTYMKNVENLEIYKQYKEKINENTSIRYKEIGIINAVESDFKEIENIIQDENIEKIEDINKENIINNKILDNLKDKEELKNKKEELEKLRINMEFLGLDLNKVPTQNLNDWKIYIIPILYVITSIISIKMSTNNQSKKENKKDIIIQKEEDKDNQEDMMESMQQMNNSMIYMMPIMSISIAAIAPLGLALYWLVSNVLIIIERLLINKIFKGKEENENE